MRKWIGRVAIGAAVVVLGLAAFFYFHFIRLPQPQIASAVGTVAPDFTLPDQNGQPFHLADLHGQRVLLMFYRGAW
jgi:cytochrome oxidase Cu insertion factor (SCO1/SenC/PrrC family)